ncbi:hypothetical protein [Saccharothrix sp. HUAS TT1]|uniref:hypothetical protein n=1 Tax=unclassified Saccharothrix TaxID=2593673 RepID=UPI00345BE08D
MPPTPSPDSRHAPAPARGAAVVGDVLAVPDEPPVGSVLRGHRREFTRVDGGWTGRRLDADGAPDWMPDPAWPALLERLQDAVLVTADGDSPIGLPDEPPVGCRVTTPAGDEFEHRVLLGATGGAAGWVDGEGIFHRFTHLLREHGSLTVTRDEADVLAAQALAGRVDGLRHTGEYAAADGTPLVFHWRSRVQWPVRGYGRDQWHTATGNVVEAPYAAQRFNEHVKPPHDDSPGRVWWALGSYPELEPFRIGLVTDDELPAAIRLLLAAARKRPDRQ